MISAIREFRNPDARVPDPAQWNIKVHAGLLRAVNTDKENDEISRQNGESVDQVRTTLLWDLKQPNWVEIEGVTYHIGILKKSATKSPY